MRDLTKLLRESLPEIIGGLAVAAILALIALLYAQLGTWTIPALLGALVLGVVTWVLLTRTRKRKPPKSLTPSTAKTTSPPTRTSSADKPTILFVDDDIELIGSFFIMRLEEQGFQVVAATNVLQAIQALESGQPLDLVITDLMLPYGAEKQGESRLLGLEVIRAARNLRGQIPIICFSVVSDTQVIQQLHELGVNEHIPKPVTTPSEFVERVKLVVLLSTRPLQQDLIQEEIRRRRLELRSANPHNRIRALWAIGQIGHHDSEILGLLEDIAQNDADEDVKLAANEALERVRAKLSA